MGRGLGKLLAQRGANVIIIARNVKKLQAALEYISVNPLSLATSLHSPQSTNTHQAAAAKPQTQRFHYISADLTSAAENARILAEATAWNNGQTPEIVWANAGAAIPSLFLDASIETMRQQMDVNFWAATYLAHATLKAWLYPSASTASTSKPTTSSSATAPPAKKASEPPRHFVLTSSSIAFCNIAGYSTYGASKAALRSLADSLRSELNLYNGARRSTTSKTSVPPAPYDVQIHAIYPGTILSPGHDLEEETKHDITRILEESDPRQSEDEVAIAAIKGLERGDYMVATNWLGQLMRVSAMQGSPRDNIVWDTMVGWVVSLAWLFIGPDMEGKVWGWGKKNGMPRASG